MEIKIPFNSFYKIFNFISIILISISLLLLIFKGLNFGIDFKGGTLIELRTNDKHTNISKIRNSLSSMNLGDVNVKIFGNDKDYLIKFERKNTQNNPNFINAIKIELTKSIGKNFNFRRVENVGPKVSSELLKSGIYAIILSLAAMLFYIWIRFEWQFSLGAILALFHDVIITLGLFSLFSLVYFPKFSLILSYITTVSFIEYPTIVKIAATIDKFISKLNNEKRPKVIITS